MFAFFVYHPLQINNQGVANARNFAIGKVTAQYITFIDSDDFVDEDYK